MDSLVPYHTAIEALKTLLTYIGEDLDREGLKNTPFRVIESYRELFSGYDKKPEDVLKYFHDAYDEMVIVRDIEFTSMCEHHMLPFIGKAHIAYIPSGRVVGLSKLVRLFEVFSRRLQIQERLTQQVAQALDTHLMPKGTAVVVEAKHLCMSCRGVNKQHSVMVTSCLIGEFRVPEVRQEFFNLIRSK